MALCWADLLLDQIGFLDERIGALSARAAELAVAMPAAWGVDGDGPTGTDAGAGPDAAVPPVAAGLGEIPGISPDLARTVIAKQAWTCPGSSPPPTWCRGPGCARPAASPPPS